jgi:hypothetical protein
MVYLHGKVYLTYSFVFSCNSCYQRFVFSARISPEDVHKRTKRQIDTVTGEYDNQSCSYPSLTHIMYFIHLMHHEEPFTLKFSQAANDILIRTHDQWPREEPKIRRL